MNYTCSSCSTQCIGPSVCERCLETDTTVLILKEGGDPQVKMEILEGERDFHGMEWPLVNTKNKNFVMLFLTLCNKNIFTIRGKDLPADREQYYDDESGNQPSKKIMNECSYNAKKINKKEKEQGNKSNMEKFNEKHDEIKTILDYDTNDHNFIQPIYDLFMTDTITHEKIFETFQSDFVECRNKINGKCGCDKSCSKNVRVSIIGFCCENVQCACGCDDNQTIHLFYLHVPGDRSLIIIPIGNSCYTKLTGIDLNKEEKKRQKKKELHEKKRLKEEELEELTAYKNVWGCRGVGQTHLRKLYKEEEKKKKEQEFYNPNSIYIQFPYVHGNMPEKDQLSNTNKWKYRGKPVFRWFNRTKMYEGDVDETLKIIETNPKISFCHVDTNLRVGL